EEPLEANGRGGEEPLEANGRGGEEPLEANGRGGEEPLEANGRGGEEPLEANGRGGEEQLEATDNSHRDESNSPTEDSGDQSIVDLGDSVASNRPRRDPQPILRLTYDKNFNQTEFTGLATRDFAEVDLKSLVIPDTHEQAMDSPHAAYWREAEQEEIK